MNIEPILVEVAIEPKSRADQEKMGMALLQLQRSGQSLIRPQRAE